MINFLLIVLGKLIISISRLFNLGNGSTWPGHIALNVNKNFIKNLLKNSSAKIILIAGTNGKTTTGKLIQTILEKNGKKTFQNQAGANLLNGIASALIQHSNITRIINYDYAIFEIDENTLPLILKELSPDFLLILNLFRDQLDRYGEVNTIALKWKQAINQLTDKTTLILNADDPQIAYLGKNIKPKVLYFGLDDKSIAQSTHQHAVDSTHCPSCGTKLNYKLTYFSHLGIWECKNCQLKRPAIDKYSLINYPLDGVYNRYNTHAAILIAKTIGMDREKIDAALYNFIPVFGRQEIVNVHGKKVKLFLSKNPTSFNQSLRTVKELGGKTLLVVLNDRIPDGRDVSWIWDVDFEEYLTDKINIYVSGDRAYDMGLRLKYAGSAKFQIEENLKNALAFALENISQSETLYILPTYSAMLEVRKILTGKKIL